MDAGFRIRPCSNEESSTRQNRIRSASGKTMANETKKPKADPAPKSEVAAKETSAPADTAAKTETASEPAAPSRAGRGEGQKPVTAAYKENWNAIFAKKAKTKTKPKTKAKKKSVVNKKR
jgi:hypothetical protein